MSRRYCSVCGELLPDGKKFCLNCGTKYQEPKKNRLANTEPVTLISFPEDEKEDAVVIEQKAAAAESTPEETVPAEEKPAEQEIIETVPEEVKPEEPAAEESKEEESSDSAKEMITNMFPDLKEEAEPEDEPGTEELPVLDEEMSAPNIHLNDLIADTNSTPQVEDRYEIPTFPKRSAGGTEILEGTPIDTSVTTRMYERPKTEPQPEEKEEPENDDYDDEDYYDDEEEEGSGSTKILIGILVVLLCLVIGAFAYLWVVRPELLGRSKASAATEKTSETVPEETETDSSVQETADSTVPESADAESTESAEEEETVELGNTVDLTQPAAAVDSELTSGDPVEVPDVDADAVIGYAGINVETLLVFEDHSVSSTAIGHARYDANYEVIGKYDDGEYTWYQIADQMWVPDSNGQWIAYQAK